jgi:hypothetical protein
MTGVTMTDINGQPKVFHRDLLNTMIHPPTDFSFDAYVLLRAHRERLSCHAFDVRFEQRLHGESKWATTLLQKHKTILHYIRSIFFMALRRA